MATENALIDGALRNWHSNMDRVGKFFRSLSDDDLQKGIAPGKNRLIYIWGHLSAANDRIIRDEVYAIGREALVNSFRHSGASRIEVDAEYSISQLRVLVRDDGCGIDAQVLECGRDGHWGLSGMRERAEKIGAKLRL